MATDEDEDGSSSKPLKLDENNELPTPTSPIQRDPCHGPAASKRFVSLGLYQPDLKFSTINNRHFCRQ
jgi:hypothetical protein